MRRISTFRSGAFRFALLLAVGFAASAVLLLFVMERSISRYAAAATEGGLRSEAAILQDEEREGGRDTLLKEIARHRRAGGQEAFHYQVADRAGQMLLNDVDDRVARLGNSTVSVRDDEGGPTAHIERLQSLGVKLSDGGVLVVATDTYDILQVRNKLDWFTIFAGVGITMLAIAGGYLTGGLFMRRLERVNQAIDRIVAGNFAERLPTIGISPEFDLLTTNFNALLDRIGALMDGLRQVTTDIAHDLRTPLTRLRQQLEATLDARDPAHYEESIENAIVQTDEILVIFRALLRIGTLEGGDGRQHFGAVDLSEVLGRVVAAHQPVAEDAGKTLLGEHAPGLWVKGDADLLAQMMANLIDNAIRHTPAGCRIVSTLERNAAESTDGHVVVTIHDNGPGIPPEERANVLTRFYRLDRSRNLPGAGLGMSLAAAIASLHHVQFDLLDNDPGLRIRLLFPDDA